MIPVAAYGECRWHKPEREDTTRWGGKEAMVVTPDEHYREVRGVVEGCVGNAMLDAVGAGFFGRLLGGRDR